MSVTRVRALVAVVFQLPLFVEALGPAFEGIADLQPISAKAQAAHGLLRALRPDAVVVEGAADAFVSGDVPCIAVDLVEEKLRVYRDARWRELEVEVSPESIRNVTVAQLFGGDPA